MGEHAARRADVSGGRVLVYGATGWTGAMVTRALCRDGVPVVLAGRDADKLDAVARRHGVDAPARVADVGDLRALVRAMHGTDVVVSCVGPYVELGRPVVEAAIEAGCHYFDVSGEESYLHEIYAACDERARRRGVTLCAGFAAKGALGDWGGRVAASRLPAGARVEEVAVAYAHGLQEYFRPSVGSVLSAAGQGFFHQAGSAGHRWSTARRFAFPPPFDVGWALLVPGADDISIPRHLAVDRVRSYIALDPGGPANAPWAWSSLALLRTVPVFSRFLTSRLGRTQLARVIEPPQESTATGTFAVAVEARSGGHVVRMGIGTRDAYGVTADIVSYGVRQLLHAEAAPRGVIPPSVLCDPERALRSLSHRGSLEVLRFGAEP